jgi:hypothetical protein
VFKAGRVTHRGSLGTCNEFTATYAQPRVTSSEISQRAGRGCHEYNWSVQCRGSAEKGFAKPMTKMRNWMASCLRQPDKHLCARCQVGHRATQPTAIRSPLPCMAQLLIRSLEMRAGVPDSKPYQLFKAFHLQTVQRFKVFQLQTAQLFQENAWRVDCRSSRACSWSAQLGVQLEGAAVACGCGVRRECVCFALWW